MKFTKPEARYLVQNAAARRRAARRLERSVKIALECASIGAGPVSAAHDHARVVDTYRRMATERMALAMRLEAT